MKCLAGADEHEAWANTGEVDGIQHLLVLKHAHGLNAVFVRFNICCKIRRCCGRGLEPISSNLQSTLFVSLFVSW